MTYLVSWNIDDDDSTTPLQAAQSALRLLHNTYYSNPDDANVFTVVDTAKDLTHEIDLGDSESEVNLTRAIWPRPAGARAESRLNAVDARYLATKDRRVNLLVRVDQEEYLAHYAMYLSGSGGDDHFDLLHNSAFSFGVTYDSSAEIVSVDPATSTFVVRYDTELVDIIREV